MTETVKTSRFGRWFWAQGLTGARTRLRPLQALTLSAVALGFQVDSQAQGNLVDLYNWHNETKFSSSPQNNVQIDSEYSALFFGSLSTNNSPCPLAVPALEGDLDTTPGTIYEISFTLQNDFITVGQAKFTFGDFSTNFDLPPAEEISPTQVDYFPVNINVTLSATSLDSSLTFTLPIDVDDAVTLDNLTVTEVPETSSATIFGVFGCAWLVVGGWRKRFKAKWSLDPARVV